MYNEISPTINAIPPTVFEIHKINFLVNKYQKVIFSNLY
jgi:hypothetical protein